MLYKHEYTSERENRDIETSLGQLLKLTLIPNKYSLHTFFSQTYNITIIDQLYILIYIPALFSQMLNDKVLEITLFHT